MGRRGLTRRAVAMAMLLQGVFLAYIWLREAFTARPAGEGTPIYIELMGPPAERPTMAA
ncbi:MAG: hypothetical protein QOE92_838 [Chloroflexota bacterium]|nr:hypothetical protein [Chloroflexota bacterium]